MQDNSKINFALKGFTSIFIGIYFLLGSYIIHTVLEGFLIDNNPLGMLSAELIEILFLTIALLVFIFSTIALFFRGKKNAKKHKYKLWNVKSKKAFGIYTFLILVIFSSLLILKNKGFINYLTPVFLIEYAILLVVFKSSARKSILVLGGLCLLLGTICFLIPSYWYSSITILGIAHITYGVVVKN